MNITDYLLLPEQAKWAKEKGFRFDCIQSAPVVNDVAYPKWNTFPTTLNDLTHTIDIPTFSQFFDWVEEKWHVETRIVRELQSDEPAYYFTLLFDDTFEVYNSAPIYKTKRSARIAACEAIKKHVEENKL